jgi:hypothetical protein
MIYGATGYTGHFAAIVRVDFTGDLGHKIGSLGIKRTFDGLIERIEADLG